MTIRHFDTLDLGLTSYEQALETQRAQVGLRRCGAIGDTLILTEHEAVITIGRAGTTKSIRADSDLLRARGIRVIRVDRGGDATVHSPGQLVVYPIVDIGRGTRDLHAYLRALELAVISTLRRFGIAACRVPDRTGVWVGEMKIASIGVASRNWIMYHGLSINVSNDTGLFDLIHPCGMPSVRVTSMRQHLGRVIRLADVRERIVDELEAALFPCIACNTRLEPVRTAQPCGLRAEAS